MMTLTWLTFLLFVLKAFVVVMFAMNVAVVLTWVDRRQGAMIQDRIGPNRAVAWIPTPAAQGMALLPALAVAGGVLFVVLKLEPPIGLRLAGLLHPAADGLKTMFKEDFIPPEADKFLHSLAPFISFFPALVVMAVIPFGDTLCFGLKDGQLSTLMSFVPRDGVCVEGAVKLQVVDLDVGLLYFFALAGTGIVGAALAGWA